MLFVYNNNAMYTLMLILLRNIDTFVVINMRLKANT